MISKRGRKLLQKSPLSSAGDTEAVTDCSWQVGHSAPVSGWVLRGTPCSCPPGGAVLVPQACWLPAVFQCQQDSRQRAEEGTQCPESRAGTWRQPEDSTCARKPGSPVLWHLTQQHPPCRGSGASKGCWGLGPEPGWPQALGEALVYSPVLLLVRALPYRPSLL